MQNLGDFPYISLKEVKRAVVVCHRHADIDAYCSAYALRLLLRRLKPSLSTMIAAPSGLNKPAKRLAAEFPAPILEEPTTNSFQLAIAVDTGHAALLQQWKDVFQQDGVHRILIDHHPPDPSMVSLTDRRLVDPNSSSTCELVYRLYAAKEWRPSSRAAASMMAGILTDTQNLASAGCTTLERLVHLCHCRARIELVRRLLIEPPDPSEVMARLKAAQRMKIQRISRWFAAVTRVGAYQASAARGLIGLGADVAIAVGGQGAVSQGSLRATRNFFEATGLHLGTHIARRAADLLKGAVGGGHARAASLHAQEPPEKVSDLLLNLLQKAVQGAARRSATGL